jgi:hypothetical protein
MSGRNIKYMIRGVGLLALVAGAFFVLKHKQASDAQLAHVGDAIPPALQIDPHSVSKVVADKEGKEYISNQIIIEFVPEINEGEAQNVISGIGGTLLERFTKVPLCLVRIPDYGDGVGAQNALRTLSGNSKVKKASLNYLSN